MKNLKHTITLIALFTFLFNYGQKNNPMDYVGKKHNYGLNEIYKQFSTKKGIKSKKEAVIEILNFTNNKFNKNNETLICLYDKENDVFSVKSLDYYFRIIEKKKGTIPIEYKKYMYKFEKLMNNHDKQGLVNLVDKVKKDIKDANIKEKVLAAIAIGYNSMEYWDKNETKWKKLKFIPNTKKPWWKVAAVDGIVAGFGIVSGLVTGGIAWGATGWATARASAIAAVMIQ